jgi:site-specific recombinase XerD
MDFKLHISTDLIDAYLADLVAQRPLADRTLLNYRAELTPLVSVGLPLTRQGAVAWISVGPSGKELAPTSRNRRLSLLRTFIGFLMRRGVLGDDPTTLIRRAYVPFSREAALAPRELRRLFEACDAGREARTRVRDRAMLGVLVYTGLRLAELVALDLDNLHLERRILRCARRKGGHVTDEHLNAPLRRSLRAYIALRRMASSPALFLASRGGRLTRRGVQARLTHLGDVAGVRRRVHPHALRHAHATELERREKHLPVIQDSMAHTALSTTRRYIHVADSRVKAARDRMTDFETGRAEQGGRHGS